ncbi:TonB-dependent receptor [Sphingomonas sp. CCH10-B3]|uniref:TonB-dependent receptor n=1 Tax=Sphingomonas sp. CCH10-B3 TaxID=1768757 RepID=UPI000834678F|nr:TonB-dependent receptor [Sphingomonas sp. CCH10-B3]
MTKFDLLAATAIAVLATSPAMAQTAPAPAPAAQEDAPVADDVVVTATKRETTLLDTPISVSVTSGATIQEAQIRDLIDLQTVVPSLRVSQLQSSANTNFIIRGFGNGANNPGIEPSVGVFIDGVYRSRSAAQIADLPNVKRVEVLRGPQSTLFGKNASAGIISIVTAEPAFKFGGNIEATYGDFNAFILKGDVTGPITDTLAFSLAGNFNRRDGYVRDLALNTDFNDRNRYGFRGQLLFQPSADLKFRLIADFDSIDENCCAVVNLVNGPTGAVVRALGGNIVTGNPFSYTVFNNFRSVNRIDNYGISLQGDADFDKFTLTSISSARGVDSRTNQDSDFTSADLIGTNNNRTNIRTLTHEVRFASNFGGRFEFLVGGYYFNESIDVKADLTFGRDFRNYAQALSGNGISTVEGLLGVPANTFSQRGQGRFENWVYRNNAFSFFGSADFKITNRLVFTGGINYTNDKKRFSSASFSTDSFSALDFVAIGRNVLTQTALAQGVGGAIGLPAGTAASAAQIQGFAAAQPAIFAQIQAGANAFGAANANTATNPLLGLRALQFLPPFLNLPNAVEPGRTADDDVSYSLRLAWKATNNISFYVTYGTGFKASSINLGPDSRPTPADFIPGSPAQSPAPGASPIRTAGLALPNLTTGSRFAAPEKAKVIEGGIKGQFSKGAFNLAIFQQEISNFQGNIFTGTGFVLSNAGRQSTFGIEFDGNYSPVRALTLNFDITYLKPRYDSFVNASALNAGFTTSPANLTGLTPAGIPEVSLSAGFTYRRTILQDVKMFLRSDYQWSSNTQIAEGAPQFRRQITSLNSSLSFELKNGLEFSFWGRNLFDKQYISTIFPSVVQTGSLSGYPSQPRTYGGTVRFKF